MDWLTIRLSTVIHSGSRAVLATLTRRGLAGVDLPPLVDCMRSRPLVPALACALLLPSALDAAWELREGDQRLEVLEDGEVVTAYRHDASVPYVYPLPSPSGANLARRWPIEEAAEGEETDHPHHRSFWLSHGGVDEFDFWHGRKGEEIEHLEIVEREAGDDHAAFTVRLSWRAGGRERLLETRRYRFSRPDENSLAIEVRSDFEAREAAVTFQDTKEGTFAVRVDRSLRHQGEMAKGNILDSEGRRDQACWGKRSKWVAFHGPDERGEAAVIAIFDHPSNLRHPTWWHARSYGLLAANPFGIHDFEDREDEDAGDFELAKGESLTQRYLLLIHHGAPASAKLDVRWNNFSQPETP